MDFMAGCADYATAFVLAARPMVAQTAGVAVATHAGGVLLVRCRSGKRRVAAALGAEQHVRCRTSCLAFGILDVGFALAVTGLAGRGAGIALDAMPGLVDRQHGFGF